MPWFVKTERFKSSTLSLMPSEREKYLSKHREWVIQLNSSGNKASSGYLVNSNRLPGGGGLLIFQAKSYEEAKALVEEDPMIVNDLVEWNLQEWIPFAGEIYK